MEGRNIVIISAGTMGHGIAQTGAIAGYSVTLIDIAPKELERGVSAIQKSVYKLFRKGIITSEQKSHAETISTSLEI